MSDASNSTVTGDHRDRTDDRPNDAAAMESRPADSVGVYYPSLASLRAAHSELLKRRRESGGAPEFLAEVEAFVQRGRATGMLLDAEEDRWSGQSLLDYWASTLDRAGLESPDATLDEFDPALAPDLHDDLCPYLGLDAFREAQHDVFFGRQRLVGEMVDRLRDGRLLAVVGPSGSGKSSLVLAGLLPALKAGAVGSATPNVPGSQGWHYYPPMVPGSDPLANLARLLQPSGVGAAEWAEQQADLFRQDPDRLLQLLRKEGVPTVLVVDQFEELFTLCLDDDVRQAFMDNVLSLIRESGKGHTTGAGTPVVILTMRVDFEPHVASLPAFLPLFEAAQVRVPPLSASELREAIEKPAALVGLKFEEGVVDALLRDILGEPAALPLLQFTLLKLWENRERNRVTWEAYQRLGGGRQALARSADAFYDGLIPEEQVTARRILLRMVRPGEGLEVTSNRVRRETLYQAGEARDRIDRVLDRFVRARLVRLTEGETLGDAQVEVAHEALVRNWPRLVGWLEDERESMRRRLRLTAAAEQWETAGRDPGALLRGALLREALRWQDLNELETEYVRASQAAVERAEREKEAARQRELAQARALAEEQMRRAEAERQRAEEQAKTGRHLRWLVGGLAGVLVLAIVATVFALNQWNESQQLLRLSISHRLTAAAIGSLGTYPERSILLALEAVSATYVKDKTVTREADSALRRAMQASRIELTLLGHGGPVYGVAYSPDGTRLATASGDRRAKVWDAASGEELLTLSGHSSLVRSVAFSPDGTRLATASEDKTTRVWDAVSGEELLTLSGHGGPVWSVAFSPDGTRLATASKDGTVKVWDIVSGEELFTLSGHGDPVYGVAFSPDGTRLATASEDKTAKVWSLVSGVPASAEMLLTLSGHIAAVRGVAFSPDGMRLATTSEDGTAKVWSLASSGAAFSEELLTFSNHSGPVYGLAFSPDGVYLATAGEDKTVKVWSASIGQELLTLFGHTGPVWSIAFDPQGTHLATASVDRTARVWNTSASRELLTLAGHTAAVHRVVYSPDGTQLATASRDRTAKVWDAATGEELLTLSGHTGPVWSVAFSPDGTRLATASEDKTAIVWDLEASAAAASSKELLTLSGHTDWVNGVAFSPDGTRLATASRDRTAKVWSLASGEALLTLSGHRGWVWGVPFSPDGKRLATASYDGTAKVWDAVSGKEKVTFSGHSGEVYCVAFGPEGKRLATSGEDKTAKVWDAASGEELLTLSGHSDWVAGVAFGLDGARLATASMDKTARVWDAASGEELVTFTGYTEWIQSVAFSPDGTRLAVASEDGTVRVYVLNVGELMALACSQVTRNLTQLEWETYLGRDVPYRRTCPDLPIPPPWLTYGHVE